MLTKEQREYISKKETSYDVHCLQATDIQQQIEALQRRWELHFGEAIHAALRITSTNQLAPPTVQATRCHCGAKP